MIEIFFIECDNLKALNIFDYHPEFRAKIVIPVSVTKLRLRSVGEVEVLVEPEQLEWFQWDSTYTGDLVSRMMANRAISVGPYLVCRPDVLRLKRPPTPVASVSHWRGVET